MALSNTDREVIGKWAGEVETASSWFSGTRSRKLAALAAEMKALAEGDATSKELAEENAEF